jgi:single-strand DNA-binding protein
MTNPNRHNPRQRFKETLMRDIATTTLSGNLTRDVELRQLPSGADIARLRIATTTRRRSGEEWVDKTNYFTVEVFGAQARACAQYLAKGSRVLVDAEPDWREWTDQQNNKREAVTFKARHVLFEGARRDPTPDVNGASEPTPASAAVAVTQPPVAAPLVAQEAGSTAAQATADDLPF